MRESSQPPDEFPFVFEQVRVSSTQRNCEALLMTPRTRTVFGEQRRAALRDTRLSPVEQGILSRVATRPNNTPILILRGADDFGNRLWEFDPNFDDQQLEETGRAFSRSVMPLYRQLVAHGIVLFVHADWGNREIPPIRRGLAQLADDLGTTHSDPAVSALDEWVIRNVLLYSSLSLRHVIEKLLPEHLSLLARREARAARLVEALPRGILDTARPLE